MSLAKPQSKQLFLALLLLSTLPLGCSRTHYRLRADRDAYGIVHEKADYTPWSPPSDYSVYPDPGSRLYDPTCTDDPALPIPSPQLYNYELPPIAERDPGRFRRQNAGPTSPTAVPSAADSAEEGESSKVALTGGESLQSAPALQRSPRQERPRRPLPPEPGSLRLSASASDDRVAAEPREGRPTPFQTVSLQITPPPAPTPPAEAPAGPPQVAAPATSPRTTPRLEKIDRNPAGDLEDIDAAFGDDAIDNTLSRRRVPIPDRYWNAIPAACLRRMLEFESVVNEYEASYDDVSIEGLTDDAPRLALEDIVELTRLNSRELQTEKENLYRVALNLTLDRFDYQLKPSVGNNGTAVNYGHNRNQGITVNTLGIPTVAQLDRVLWTGGDLLARFANTVVLTFNGPQGFAADVGSELFFEITQSVFQRDILLEGLTQAERDVVYAARDFARFRKQLFVTLASQYYRLIRQYRQIEIDSQNYFTLVREFNQREAEFRAGLASRIQLDQIEQQVINGRRGLLSSCTNLENALDDLKLRIGLPTEQRINLDLTELKLLTLSDELAVNTELVGRVQRRLETESQSQQPARATLLSSSTVLVDRVLESIRIRNELGEQDDAETQRLLPLRTRLQIEAARVNVEEARREMTSELAEDAPSQPVVFQRRMDMMNELILLMQLQLDLGELREAILADDPVVDRVDELAQRTDELIQAFSDLLAEQRLDQLRDLLSMSETLQADAEQQVDELDRRLQLEQPGETDAEKLQFTQQLVDEVLTRVQPYVQTERGGLVPVEIEMDDATMTALVQRFELINQRGELADNWRRIKYAADDLKSILNLRASQSIRTPDGQNLPFDFSFDDSTTRLSATFDAPFNRRAQRNAYRNSLINYQAALRRVMQLEDTIKLDVRRDLRSLELDSEQYVNDIASAALAFERVVSTDLELRLGIGNVAARDFLEAQNAYIGALSNVASRHIDYIVGRLQLFLDLESLTVNDDGFWEQLYDESYQPTPAYQLPAYALPPYGELHPCLRYSDCIRRMLCVPVGTAINHERDEIQMDSLSLESLDEMIEELPAGEVELEEVVAPEPAGS